MNKQLLYKDFINISEDNLPVMAIFTESITNNGQSADPLKLLYWSNIWLKNKHI